MRKRCVVGLLAVVCCAGAFALPHPEIVWEYAFGVDTSATPVLYPSTDAPEGLIVLTPPGLLTLFSGQGDIVWQHDLEEISYTTPAVGDIDGDGIAEVVSAIKTGAVVVLNADGTERWRRQLGESITGTQGPTLPDLDGDGAREILCGTNSGYVTCLNGQGDFLWRIRTDVYRNTPVTVIPGASGLPEMLVFGTENDHVAGVAPDGDLMWLAQQESQFGRSHLIAGELDGDPGYELTVNTSFNNPNSRLIVLNAEDGSLAWDAKLNLHGYACSSIVDVDGDGKNEALLALRSNTVYLFNGDGSERWHTITGGQSYFYTGAVADLDGDGVCEIITGVRDSNMDGASWFVLNLKGEIIGAYPHPGGAVCAPIVCDLNQDGKLDVIMSGTRGTGVVRCYTFGGPAGARVAWSGHRVDAARLGCVVQETAPTYTKPAAAANRLDARWQASPTWGSNDLAIDWPKMAGTRTVVTITVTDPQGRKTVDVLDVAPADLPDTLPITFIGKGKSTAAVRLFDPADWSSAYADWSDKVKVGSFDAFAERATTQLAAVEAAADAMPVAAGGTTRLLKGVAAKRLSALDAIAERAAKVDLNDVANVDAFADELARFSAGLREDLKRAEYAKSAVAISEARPLAVWADPNPWDEIPALLDGVSLCDAPALEASLYKDEYESGCLCLLNLQPVPLSVQLRLDKAAAEAVLLYEVLDMPRPDGTSVDDCLAELNSASTVRLAPGEVRRLWVTFNGKALEPGDHDIPLTIVPIGYDTELFPVALKARVDSLSLSEAPIWRSCNWFSQAACAGSGMDDAAIAVAREHGENIWTSSLPHPKVDAAGRLSGLDWSQLDAELAHYGDTDFALFHHTHVPVPEGAQEHDALHLKAERAFLEAVIAHMAGIGWDGRWALYPVDEPGLFGGTRIEMFVKCAKFFREAVPEAPIYANPAGFVTPETMAAMVPYVDYWCPEQAVMRRTDGLSQFFLDTGKPVWSYEAPGDVKSLKPLGYYRANAWLAFQLGLHGTGYWTQLYAGEGHGGNDLYLRKCGSEYGANYAVNGRETISRRWEATRDGHEDVRAFLMLRNAAAKAKAEGRDAALVTGAEKLLGEAVPEAASKAHACGDITRFLRDYEMDHDEIVRIRAEAARLTQALLGE